MRFNSSLHIHKLGKVYMIVDSCADNSNLATVYTLNSTAGWLWLRNKGREFTAGSLTDMLCESFDVDRSRAEADVNAVIEKLRAYGLITD